MRRMIVAGVLVLSLTACGTPEKPVTYTPPSVLPSSSASYDDYGIGMPPTPDLETRKTYIAELNRIDPDIVHGKEQTAVERGRNQCSSIKTFPNDEAKWVTLTLQRFTSPKHPDGFGTVKASKILVVVRRYICPSY